MAHAKGEVPQYKLTGPVYLSDTMYYNQQMIDNAPAEGIIVYFTGIPNGNMEPVNDAAREMVEKHPVSRIDPLGTLTRVSAMEADTPQGMAKMIGASIAEALRGLLPGGKKPAPAAVQ